MSAGFLAYREYARVMELQWPLEKCTEIWAREGPEEDRWRAAWEAAARANGPIEVSSTPKIPAKIDFLKLNAGASGR